MANRIPSMSNEDLRFVAEQLGLELFYARRDAHATHVGNQPKSASKLRFDRDRYNRMQVIAAAFVKIAGIDPIERQPADFAGFMSRMGATLDVVQEQPAPRNDDMPWDMNRQF